MKPSITIFCTSALLLMFGLSSPCGAAKLRPEEQKIVAYLKKSQDQQITLLEELSNINSGTLNKTGVKAVSDVFMREFADMGFELEFEAMPDSVNRAGHFYARRSGTKGKRLMLIGHLDTVFESDSSFQKFERKGANATGPGVVDMKGGNIAILFALKALHQQGLLDDTSITVVFTGDEESVGDPISTSRASFIQAAKNSDIALGFEGGSPGLAVAGRRGSSSWKIDITAKQAHSSGVFSSNVGPGAIYEAARILNAFYTQLHPEKNLTFNAALIIGGSEVQMLEGKSSGNVTSKLNIVPPSTIIKGDLRFISQQQLSDTQNRMHEIVSQNLPHAKAEIEFFEAYPAMFPTEKNLALVAQYSQVSQDLGFGKVEAQDPGTRGAGDISFVAEYVDCIDGLGVFGRGSHTENETIELGSLQISSQRAALMIYRLTR